MIDIASNAIQSIEAGIYVGMVVLDSDEMMQIGDDELHLIEGAIRKAGGRCAVDEDGDLRIADYAPDAGTIEADMWAAAREWQRQGGRFAVTVREIEEIAHAHGITYGEARLVATALAVKVLA